MKNNIILIGMPGSGKSTVGVLLAKQLGYNFVDTDLLISRKGDKPLQEIIDNEGLERFSQLESTVGETLDCDKTVVATGGSMVLCDKAMENLKALGKVVYLEVPVKELERRLVNFKTRGIVMRKGETIKDILNKRQAYYEKYADIVIKESPNSHMAENIEKILEKL
ncbi:MAG: shikimate kinase [Ruminococcus sp.]